jgi:hypothetical protein
VPQGVQNRSSPSVPEYWDDQVSSVELFEVPPDTNEWRFYEKKFTSSIPVTVKQITRIQNLWLWEVYQFNKYRIQHKNKGIINELMLFHGSKENNPMDICKGEDGFDLRLSNKGSWGVALYFAESIKYTDRFAHTTPEGDKEMIIVYVLTGDAYDCGTRQNKEFRMPPVKSRSQDNIQNVKYDSISAIKKDTRVYMLYETNRAYPAYVVKYQYQQLS